MRLDWEGEPDLAGSLDLAGAVLDKNSLEFLLVRNIALDVQVSCDGTVIVPSGGETSRECPLESPVEVEITMIHQQKNKKVVDSFIVRALPALHISDDEFGVEFDDLLCIEGSLQAVYHKQCSFTHKFTIWALSSCRIRLLVHVERESDRTLHSHAHPLILDFTRL